VAVGGGESERDWRVRERRKRRVRVKARRTKQYNGPPLKRRQALKRRSIALGESATAGRNAPVEAATLLSRCADARMSKRRRGPLVLVLVLLLVLAPPMPPRRVASCAARSARRALWRAIADKGCVCLEVVVSAR
jgi:hypothetical protein